jgi:ParB family chromosome partitioning protein
MEKLEKIKFKDFKEIPLSLIDIAESNVRRTMQRGGLEELKTSIQKLGLIHPIILVEKDGRYKLVVGQRRFLAFQDLVKEKIPSIIIDPVSSTTEKVISFGENIHRKALPYDDTIQVCNELFENSTGETMERIEKIAKTLGISTQTVSKYLSYRLIPFEVRQLVDNKKLSASVAYRITSAFWPNTEKIVRVSQYMTKMTNSEWERALTIGRKQPELTPEDIAREAKIPQLQFELVIPLDNQTNELLAGIAKKRHIDTVTLVRNLIDELLESETL